MFALISAYLLTDRHHKFSYDFYIKRAAKIYPTLFVFTIITILFLAQTSHFTPTFYILINMLGLNALFDGRVASHGLGNGMWFVTFILIAYLLLPLLSFLFNKFNVFVVQIIITIFIGIIVINFPWAKKPEDYVLFTESFTWFSSGILYCKIQGQKTFLSSGKFITAIFILSWAGMIAHEYLSDNALLLYASIAIVPYWAFPLLVKVSEGVKKIAFCPPIIVFISTISFEIYLSHFYIIGHNLEPIIGVSHFSKTAFFCYSLLLTIAVSYAIHIITVSLKKLLVTGRTKQSPMS